MAALDLSDTCLGDPAFDDGALRLVSASLLAHMDQSKDLERSDRLWPADPMAFQTNPLSLAYGACGSSLFVYDMSGCLPEYLRSWLLKHDIDVKSFPPGLYSGLAGVAWCYSEMGLLEEACRVLRLIPTSSLAFECANLFDGAAGWGLSALNLYARTKGEDFLDMAIQAARYLEATASYGNSGTPFWRDKSDDSIRLGLAFGGSGIALFFLYLGKATGKEGYTAFARGALSFEISQAKEVSEELRWGVSTEASATNPYWLRGSGGITDVLVRFHRLLGDVEYIDTARRAALGSMAFFSVTPHLFEGLASMGETMLDMYRATGEELYLDHARLKARQILLYKLNRPTGIAFPGRYLLRISHDYGYGGAGIGLFLNRLVTQGPRRFHDLEL